MTYFPNSVRVLQIERVDSKYHARFPNRHNVPKGGGEDDEDGGLTEDTEER